MGRVSRWGVFFILATTFAVPARAADPILMFLLGFARNVIERQATESTFSLKNRTLPSHISPWTPPVCQLRAAFHPGEERPEQSGVAEFGVFVYRDPGSARAEILSQVI